jgi:hypothetical protein
MPNESFWNRAEDESVAQTLFTCHSLNISCRTLVLRIKCALDQHQSFSTPGYLEQTLTLAPQSMRIAFCKHGGKCWRDCQTSYG